MFFKFHNVCYFLVSFAIYGNVIVPATITKRTGIKPSMVLEKKSITPEKKPKLRSKI